MKRSAILLLTILMLSGCGNHMWVRPGSNQVDAQKDQYECLNEASRTYPVHLVQEPDNIFFPNGRNKPVETTCQRFGNQVSCQSTGGYEPPTYSTIDANRHARERAISYCMGAKGWTYKFISKQDQTR